MPSCGSAIAVKRLVWKPSAVAVAIVEVDDLAQEQRVIAAVVVPPWAALEVREDAGQPRNQCTVDPHRGAAARARELPGDRLLLGAQDVDAERAALQRVVRARTPRHADEHERRLHRDRR